MHVLRISSKSSQETTSVVPVHLGRLVEEQFARAKRRSSWHWEPTSASRASSRERNVLIMSCISCLAIGARIPCPRLCPADLRKRAKEELTTLWWVSGRLFK